jgi:hypothetical protein
VFFYCVWVRRWFLPLSLPPSFVSVVIFVAVVAVVIVAAVLVIVPRAASVRAGGATGSPSELAVAEGLHYGLEDLIWVAGVAVSDAGLGAFDGNLS